MQKKKEEEMNVKEETWVLAFCRPRRVIVRRIEKEEEAESVSEWILVFCPQVTLGR